MSAFRPRRVPGPTSKIVVPCPSPNGLARDGTQRGENHGSCYPAPEEDALAVGVTSVREGERESEPVRQPVLPRDPPPHMRALDLPFIDARRGSRCTMGGVAMC
jgi:cell division septation protein DedD